MVLTDALTAVIDWCDEILYLQTAAAHMGQVKSLCDCDTQGDNGVTHTI